MQEPKNWMFEYNDSFFLKRKTKVYGPLTEPRQPLPMPERGTSPKREPEEFKCRFCGRSDVGECGESGYYLSECIEMTLCYQCAEQRAFCYECGDEMPTPCPDIKQEDIVCVECSDLKLRFASTLKQPSM